MLIKRGLIVFLILTFLNGKSFGTRTERHKKVDSLLTSKGEKKETATSLLGTEEQGMASSLLGTEVKKGMAPSLLGTEEQGMASSLLGTEVKKGMAPSLLGSEEEKRMAPSLLGKEEKKGMAPSLLGKEEKKGMAPSLLGTEKKKGMAPSLLGTKTKKRLSKWGLVSSFEGKMAKSDIDKSGKGKDGDLVSSLLEANAQDDNMTKKDPIRSLLAPANRGGGTVQSLLVNSAHAAGDLANMAKRQLHIHENDGPIEPKTKLKSSLTMSHGIAPFKIGTMPNNTVKKGAISILGPNSSSSSQIYRSQSGGEGTGTAAGSGGKTEATSESTVSFRKHGKSTMGEEQDDSESGDAKRKKSNPTIETSERSSKEKTDEKCECGKFSRNHERIAVNGQDYDTIVHIDSGKEGDVDHGYSINQNKCVAIKFCEQLMNAENESPEAWGCHKEIEVMQATNNADKKHIVKMLDYQIHREVGCKKIITLGGEKCDQYYIVMELGKISLDNLVKYYKEGRSQIEIYNLSVEQIISDVRNGVDDLHSLGFARVDGHGGNAVIFKGDDGPNAYSVKIIDFNNIYDARYDAEFEQFKSDEIEAIVEIENKLREIGRTDF